MENNQTSSPKIKEGRITIVIPDTTNTEHKILHNRSLSSRKIAAKITVGTAQEKIIVIASPIGRCETAMMSEI